MRADVLESQGLLLADKQAQHTAAARQFADRLAGLLVDPHGVEVLQAAALRVEDPERGVAGTGELAGDIQQLLQDRLEVELGDQRAPDCHQAAEHALVQGPADLARLALHRYGM